MTPSYVFVLSLYSLLNCSGSVILLSSTPKIRLPTAIVISSTPVFVSCCEFLS